jgi:hypothetical protein
MHHTMPDCITATSQNGASDHNGHSRQDMLSEPMSVWNQCAPRVYFSAVLCFPMTEQAGTLEHIRESVHSLSARLSTGCAAMTARIRAGPSTNTTGLIYEDRSPAFQIPFEVAQGPDLHYNELKAEGFPPHRFVGPQFGISGALEPDSRTLPVAIVRALHIPGGLLLVVFLYHSAFDGNAMRSFLENLAAEISNKAIPVWTATPRFPDVQRSWQMRVPGSFEDLVRQCSEYTVLPDRSGPTQPCILEGGTPLDSIEKTGKIFVFSKERLAGLQEAVHCELIPSEHTPSSNACLAALAFAHIIKARIKTEDFLPTKPTRRREALLWSPVDWRSRALKGLTKNYIGNATLPIPTRVSRCKLLSACGDTATLSGIVQLVRTSIDAVDDDYVNKRMDMMMSAPDPRLLGANYDPRMPEFLSFNTWRYFGGADVEWIMPGVSTKKPDAIRRGQAAWSLGTALVLPTPTLAGSPDLELFVCLSKVAMDELCRDDEWMAWVERVV